MRLKTYRFFNMGIDHNYLDDARNRTLMQRGGGVLPAHERPAAGA